MIWLAVSIHYPIPVLYNGCGLTYPLEVETVTLCPHEIDDNTPYVDEAVHRDLNVTVRYYEIVASWSLEADVHLTMDWTFEAEAPRTGVLHEVARASHPADEMMPCWAT